MIKAAFFDIDGTLLSHRKGAVPEDTRRALKDLRERGILVFTSTGRHILELDELALTELGFDGYVLLNGQLCLDGDRRFLGASPVDEADIRSVLPFFEERSLPIAFVEQDRIYINHIDERVRKAQKAISSELPEVGSWDGEQPVYLVNAFGGTKDVERLLERMPHCKMTRWNPYGVDIIARESGKVMGMSRILDHFGIAKEEIIAFGDGENDLEMLSFAGIGVAMGNAEQEIKDCADYVTADIDEGGIHKALKYFEIL